MELIVHLNHLDFVNEFLDMKIKAFVVGCDVFSCRSALSLSKDQLIQLKKQVHPKAKLFVLVNALVEQKYIEDLKEHLKMLHEIEIDGILFQDFGILHICREKQYSFELIYAPDTLNTNHETLNFLATKGIDGAFLAREIPLEEKQNIAKHTNIKTMIQIHGIEYMGYSKRNLLKNYFDVIQYDKTSSKKDKITIIADKQEDATYLYEDQYGSHMLTKKQIACIDVMSQLTDFTYLYLDSLFIEPFTFVEIVYLYVQAMQDIKQGNYAKEAKNLKELLIKLDPKISYHHGFLFDHTVYKIEDVRKREANENNQ